MRGKTREKGLLPELGEHVDRAIGSRGLWPRRVYADSVGRSPGGIAQSCLSGTLLCFLLELEPVLGLGKGLAPGSGGDSRLEHALPPSARGVPRNRPLFASRNWMRFLS